MGVRVASYSNVLPKAERPGFTGWSIATVRPGWWTLAAVPPSIVRFLLVGAAGLTVNSGVFALLHAYGFSHAAARLCSLSLATLLTWQLNRRLTFVSKETSTFAELTRYGLVAAAAQGFNFSLFMTGCALLPQVPALGMLFFSAAITAAFSYASHRFFTFAGPG